VQIQAYLNKIGGFFLELVMRSPLHKLLSQSVMLLTYTGRKSGMAFTTLVNYVQQDDRRLFVTSLRSSAWWRNLRGGAPVRLHLKGRWIPAWGEVLENSRDATEALIAFLRRRPAAARTYGIPAETQGVLNMEGLRRVATDRVVVRFTLRK
jgi:deazaflavin-dependent oxidoreductase (nitroreductase family)